MKHKLLFFMAFFLPCLVFAQGNVSVKGSVIGAVSNDPIPGVCLLYTSPSPRDRQKSRMPSSA